MLEPLASDKPLPLPFFFLMSVLGFFLMGYFFPFFRLSAFFPYILLVIQRKGFLQSLWTAALIGLFFDLIQPGLRFGLMSLSFTLTTLFIYRLWGALFEKKTLPIPFFTTLFSLAFSLVQICLHTLPLTLPTLTHSIFLHPLTDGLYAFFWFTCLDLLYNRGQKR